MHIAPQSLLIARLFLLVGFGREGLVALLPFAAELRLAPIPRVRASAARRVRG